LQRHFLDQIDNYFSPFEKKISMFFCQKSAPTASEKRFSKIKYHNS
jgi:hypothetical protein